MENKKKITNGIIIVVLAILAVAFLYPIFFVVQNAFKGKCWFKELRRRY